MTFREMITPPSNQWWERDTVKRDHRIDMTESLSWIPEDIRSSLLRNKFVFNKDQWSLDHIKWIQDNISNLYYISERTVYFSDESDSTMFSLNFS